MLKGGPIQELRQRAESAVSVPSPEGGRGAPKFSLILATSGRTVELDRFFHSLAAGRFTDFECIVVDQNADGRLDDLLHRWAARFALTRLRSPIGLSRARNAGLLQAAGGFLAFPDDDCWYTPRLLPKVAAFFEQNPDYGLLSVGVRDAANVVSGNRWIQDACDLTAANLFRTSVGYALFVRRQAVAELPRFDESLGVGAGTPFASGEDTDFAFRLLASGVKGRFDRRLTIHHPRGDMFSGRADRARAFNYGCGMGRVIRNRGKFPLLPAFVGYDFARAAAGAVCGRLGAAALCVAHGRGICSGYFAPNGEAK